MSNACNLEKKILVNNTVVKERITEIFVLSSERHEHRNEIWVRSGKSKSGTAQINMQKQKRKAMYVLDTEQE